MASYRQVNSVLRALTLLEILNRQKFTSIDILHKLSKLPKPTIIRLMETLSAAGYVAKDAAGKGYRITSAVAALSSGYQGAPLVVEAARPYAQDLTTHLKWPVAIAVLDESAALVAYTTSADSPMSPYQGLLHRRLGLISRALGRAYLAFCPDTERHLILDILGNNEHPDADLDLSQPDIDALLAADAAQGYSVRRPGNGTAPSTSVAVPIFEANGDRVLGTLGITYYTSAVAWERAVSEYVPRLQSAAKGIAESVAVLQRRLKPGTPDGVAGDLPQERATR